MPGNHQALRIQGLAPVCQCEKRRGSDVWYERQKCSRINVSKRGRNGRNDAGAGPIGAKPIAARSGRPVLAYNWVHVTACAVGVPTRPDTEFHQQAAAKKYPSARVPFLPALCIE